MTRVYLADALTRERLALRLTVLDLKMEIAGEAADWPTAAAQVPVTGTDMLLVDWGLLPDAPTAALEELRRACPGALVIVLTGYVDARQRAALSADAFISKGEAPEQVAAHLRAAAARVSAKAGTARPASKERRTLWHQRAGGGTWNHFPMIWRIKS